MTIFVDIGALDDIPRQGARVIRTAQGCVAVFRTLDDRVFALDDRCPHKGGPLSEGMVHGDRVTCPLHNWVFDMNSGAAQGADEGAVRTWPVRVERGRVLISAELVSRSNAA
ncbi:nitrite reductase small subunit NirD (plasmid) [Paracoccus versutus]|uniref:Assimilatory nitrite reductase (NAD(P)H) small subunit n=1 Tax=Paracoccus versutus TaxID=34007 RepID=A0A099FLA0_PARVE|nr:MULTISPECIES: nitrite reductase small subunit NirD [Paracoccus]WGR63569.1 nitrite reductase small subunit NirD [Paracoccus ferrooxidans]SFX94391.1 assimilatory nitrite reductase (NAD(P)H) small subunit [Paracoccus pantotrophus]KGJ11016.1 tRNA-(guanine-N1)-methyltransferase [Paracoccus versutus]MBT0781951.1 nitrite reductase small subunit NirD [Paracoccus sp. pheM1]RDD70493.1 nitrite reductase (NAD(P)H) small subunit [Paracoccus versutus]